MSLSPPPLSLSLSLSLPILLSPFFSSMQKIIQRKDERIQTLEADLLRTQKEVSNLKVKITEKNDLLTQYLKDQTKPAFKHRMGK